MDKSEERGEEFKRAAEEMFAELLQIYKDHEGIYKVIDDMGWAAVQRVEEYLGLDKEDG